MDLMWKQKYIYNDDTTILCCVYKPKWIRIEILQVKVAKFMH